MAEENVTLFRLIADEKPLFLRITSAIKKHRMSLTQFEVVDAVNLDTRESLCVVVDTVLKNELCQFYPSDGYVGRSFKIRKFADL